MKKLLFAAAGGAGLRRVRRRAAERKVLRLAFTQGRDQPRSGAHRRPVLAQHHRAHLRGAATPTTTWRGRSSCRRSPPIACPSMSADLPRLDHQDQARHLLRRRSGVQGPEARAGGGRLRLPDQAHRRSEEQEPGRRRHPGDQVSSASMRCARRRSRTTSHSTTTSRSPACRAPDRYTLRSRAGRAATAVRRVVRRLRPVRRAWRARWWSSTATRSTRIRWAPGRSS